MRGISATSDSRTVLIPSACGTIVLNSATSSSAPTLIPAMYGVLDAEGDISSSDGTDNRDLNAPLPSQPMVCLATAIQPATAASVIVMTR